tara:strand:+ start:533 stop:670 length:138 start_codon:yes stop_codon:yes gene_type:complete
MKRPKPMTLEELERFSRGRRRKKVPPNPFRMNLKAQKKPQGDEEE